MITVDRTDQKPSARRNADAGAATNSTVATASPLRGRERADRLTLVVAFAVPVLWAALAALLMRPRFHASDLGLYYNAARDAMRGMAPYRDFSFEYPPLALIPMILPRLLAGGRELQFAAYQWLFLLENTLFLGLLEYYVLRIGRTWMRRQDEKLALMCFGALALISTPILPWRMDLFPALMTAAALVAVVEDRPGAAGSMIGIGFATKLYPVVLLPVFAAWYAGRRNWRGVLRLGAAAAAVSVFAFLPFVLRAPSDILSFVRYHAMRGLEIESMAAGVLMLEHVVSGGPLALVLNYGAWHLRTPATAAVLAWLPALFVLAITAVTAVAFSRFRKQEPRIDAAPALCDAVIASLLVFILANKVFSPQYLAWLLPFVALMSRRRSVIAIAMFVLTIAIFPYSFDRLVALRAAAVLLVNARNVLALASAVWLIVDLRARPAVSAVS